MSEAKASRVLVDLVCESCGGRAEVWATRPLQERVPCPACAQPARRVLGFAGLRRGASEQQRSKAPAAAACLDNRNVPGICHLGPSAARRWSAMARGDDAAVNREIAHQERAIEAGTMTPKDAVAHAPS